MGFRTDSVETTKSLHEVVNASLKFSAENTTGLVQSGILRLKGVLKPLSLQLQTGYRDNCGKVWSTTVDEENISEPLEIWFLIFELVNIKKANTGAWILGRPRARASTRPYVINKRERARAHASNMRAGFTQFK